MVGGFLTYLPSAAEMKIKAILISICTSLGIVDVSMLVRRGPESCYNGKTGMKDGIVSYVGISDPLSTRSLFPPQSIKKYRQTRQSCQRYSKEKRENMDFS